jgi:hypothetical protein
VPPLYLRPQPQAWATAAEVEDWPWHVQVAVHVLAHGVAMSEAEDPGDVMRVDQVVEEDATRHRASLHLAADGSYTCELSVRSVM